MVEGQYQPDRKDVIYLNFSPHIEGEGLMLPGVVLSPLEYNITTGLALVCPIVRPAKGGPFEVALPKGVNIQGVVLADQVRPMDWQKREAVKYAEIDNHTLAEILGRLEAILSIG